MSPGPGKQGTIQGEIDKVGEVTARSSIRITAQYSQHHTTLTPYLRQQQHRKLAEFRIHVMDGFHVSQVSAKDISVRRLKLPGLPFSRLRNYGDLIIRY